MLIIGILILNLVEAKQLQSGNGEFVKKYIYLFWNHTTEHQL